MPRYQANSYLAQNERVVKIGEELDLTVEQAKRLGDKVTLIQSTKQHTKVNKETDKE